jgi:predicted CxxxxCH...CXXCH cytochrome family protein
MRKSAIGSFATILVIIGFFATAHFFPHSAIAFVSKNSSCSASSCHGATISGATITTGINGSPATAITAAAGTTFEIDYIFTGVANGSGVGVEVAVPSGWTVAKGTANTTGLTGWSTAWNLSDGVSAWTGGYSTSAEYPNSPVGYSLDYSGTSWDTGSRNSAYDDASAGDLDGTANRMGTDVRITIPAGTPGGTYQVVVLGVGHDTQAKGHIEQVITVTVPSAGALQFSSPTYTVAENGTSATITVSRTGGSTGTASVQYATSNGTATSGSDYTTASGTLNWTAGDAASKTFTVPVTNDTVYEGNETVNLTLSNASGATLGTQTTATLTITDNETPPTVQFSTTSGSGAESVTPATMTVTLSGTTSAVPVTVPFSVNASSTATGGGTDYTISASPLTFAPGVTSQNITATIVDDALVEANETIIVNLGTPTNATLGTNTTFTYTINNNDAGSPGTIALSASAYSIGEAGPTVTITATRTGGSSGTVGISYATSSGTATAGSDFTTTNGTLSWSDGDTASKTFDIPITNDTAVEGNEDFTVTLSSPTGGASLGAPSSATITIVDNDVASAGTIALSASAYSIGEAGPTVTITATRTGGSSGAVGVTYATSDGTALAGSDYTATSNTLSWADGDTANKTFTVSIIDDAVADPNEVFTVALSSPTNGASLGSPSSANVTIIDNEASSASSSKMMHNSANTSLTYGDWGTDKNCSWCHNRDTANVKRVEQTINTPYGAKTVIFTRMTASLSSASGVFGDDQRSYALTASTNVCEVCHHKTKYHRYSSNSTYSGTTFVKTHENRSDCMTCHAHKAGFMASCDSCHGSPPNSSVAGGPNGMAKDGSNTTGFASPGAHVVHAGDPLLGNQGMACAVCHNGNSTPSHPSQTVQLGFAVNNSTWNAKFVGSNSASYGSYSGTAITAPFTYASSDAGTKVITNAGARNSCNVYCHGAWANANGTTNPRWTAGSTDAACGTCHGASNSRPPLTGSHIQHTATTTGNYGFSCSKCHTVVTGAGDGHVNGSVQWRLSTGSNLVGISGFTPQYRTGASGGTGTVAPSGSFGNCTNIYCHSAGQGSTGGAITSAEIASVQWGNFASVTCGSCHKDMSNNATAPGDHVRHSQNYGYSCGTCHKGYSATSVITANHVNKTIFLSFSGQAAGTSYGKTSPFATSLGYSNCSNSYCHSNGQSDNAQRAKYRTVSWGSALDCGGCHNNMATFANATSGSHKLHAQTGAYTCDVCHGASYGNATVPRQVNSTHVNKKINLAWTGKAAGLAYSKYSASGFAPAKGYYGTCSNLVCHGGAAVKIAWGADTTRPECMKCHGSNAASFTNVSAASIAPGYNSEGHDLAGNTAATAARVGTHQGHLIAATGISGPIKCGECHVKVNAINDTTHLNYTTATVTFNGRAKTVSHTPTVARTSGVITCNNTYCHTGTTNTGSAMAPAFNNTAYLNTTMDMVSCKKCHDMPPNPGVAGDHSSIPAALTSFPATSCNCHSNLSPSSSSYGTIFTDKNKHINGVVDVDGGHLFPYYAGYTYNEGHQGCLSGVGCHANSNPSATYPAASGAPDCRSCHKKADPTVTASCGSCHGTGINNAAAPSGTTYPDIAGSHPKHMALSIATCVYCHNTGGAGGMADHGPGNHGNTTTNPAVVNVTATQGWNSGTAKCSTSYCHSSAQGKNGTSTGILYRATPAWTAAGTTCGSCHANMATFINISSGDHARHSKDYGFQCYYCHGTGYKSTTVIDGAISTHVNNQINMAFAPLSSSLPAYGTTYSKPSSFNPGLGFGSCSNSYCHSNGQSTTARAAIKRTVTWGASAGLNCGGCHNDMATFANASSGSHKLHSQTAGYSCSFCHGASYGAATAPRTAGSTHVNKKINLTWTDKATGLTYSKYSASGFAPAKGYYGTCSNLVCHGGATAKIAWGANTTRPECMKCHGSNAASFTNVSASAIAPGYNSEGHDLAGNTNSTAARVGTHQGHLTAATGISGPIKCGECHVKVNAINDANHLNYTTATVTFNGRAKAVSHTPTVTRTSGVITCNNTYCHTGTTNTGSAMSPAFNATTYLNTTMDMASCKKCHNMPPANTDHTGIANLTAFPATSCGCHTNLNSGSTSYSNIFNNKALHIDGIIQQSSDCISCHEGAASDTANADIDSNGVRAITAEFSRTSHHVTGVTVTKYHCAVCHMEGDTSANTSTLHKNGQIDLRDVDNNTAIVWTGTQHAAMDNFCLACHDSNGVNNATVRAIVSGATATNPFNSTLTNGYDQIARSGVLDVKTQFTSTNYSHHAVLGQKYTSATPLLSASPTRFVSTFTPLGGSSSIRDTSQIHCGDCHTNGKWATAGGIGAHGSNNEYMLQTSTGTDATHSLSTYVCYKCHVGSIYSTAGGKTLGGTGAHIAGGNASDYNGDTAGLIGVANRVGSSNGNITGMVCMNCHNCGQSGWGGIHGGNATYTDGASTSQQTRRFMPGMANSKYIPGTWSAATATGCYTANDASGNWGSCDQHSSSAKGITRLPRATSY